MNDYLFPLALVGLVVGLSQAQRFWREILFAVPLMTVYEGAFRKWILPELQGPIYFVKDGMVALAFAGFLLSRRSAGAHSHMLGPLKFWLALLLPMCLAQIFNPNLPSLLVGLSGFKSYVLYITLAFLVPHAFTSTEDFQRKLATFMLLMIPVAALGLVQFVFPANHWLNTYVQHEADRAISVAEFGDIGRHTRTSGTFSYIGGYATFIEAMFAFSLGVALAGSRNKGLVIIAFVLLGVCSAGMFTTGSRSVVFGCLGMGAGIAVLSLWNGTVGAATFVRILLGGALVVVVIGFTGQDAIDAFRYRAENADSGFARFLSPLSELASAFDVTPVFGLGLGANGNATATIVGAGGFAPRNYWWLQGNAFEVETARVMQEVGVIGFTIVYALRIAMIVLALRVMMAVRPGLFRGISAAIAAFFVLHLGLFIINNPTAGVFFWYAVGLLLAMYRLEPQHLAGARRATRVFPIAAKSATWRPYAR